METPNKGSKGFAMILGMGGKPKAGSESGDSMEEQKENYLTPPNGFEPPEDAKDGQSFDITARAHMDGDQICIESINGMPMDKGDQSDSDDEGGSEEDESMQEANDESNADDESDMGKTPKSLDEAMTMQKKHKY
jgi:hypothetical protein